MSQDLGKRSSRQALSLAALGLGAILLLLVPLYLLFNSFSRNTNAELAGTWLISSVVTGMVLVAVGAALSE